MGTQGAKGGRGVTGAASRAESSEQRRRLRPAAYRPCTALAMPPGDGRQHSNPHTRPHSARNQQCTPAGRNAGRHPAPAATGCGPHWHGHCGRRKAAVACVWRRQRRQWRLMRQRRRAARATAAAPTPPRQRPTWCVGACATACRQQLRVSNLHCLLLQQAPPPGRQPARVLTAPLHARRPAGGGAASRHGATSPCVPPHRKLPRPQEPPGAHN